MGSKRHHRPRYHDPRPQAIDRPLTEILGDVDRHLPTTARGVTHDARAHRIAWGHPSVALAIDVLEHLDRERDQLEGSKWDMNPADIEVASTLASALMSLPGCTSYIMECAFRVAPSDDLAIEMAAHPASGRDLWPLLMEQARGGGLFVSLALAGRPEAMAHPGVAPIVLQQFRDISGDWDDDWAASELSPILAGMSFHGPTGLLEVLGGHAPIPVLRDLWAAATEDQRSAVAGETVARLLRAERPDVRAWAIETLVPGLADCAEASDVS